MGWKVEKVPEEGKSKKVDLKGRTSTGRDVLVECKAADDFAGEVPEKEALDILKKVVPEFDGLVITIGRPVFSAAAVEKALRNKGKRPSLLLITVGALVELLLHKSRAETLDFVDEYLLAQFTHIDVARVRQTVQQLTHTLPRCSI
jgi:hypothetical protein